MATTLFSIRQNRTIQSNAALIVAFRLKPEPPPDPSQEGKVIRRVGAGFELRHVEDCDCAEDRLRSMTLADLRGLAQFTAAGAFRPLKSAPNLQSGWRIVLPDETKLELALNQLYPGAIADWHAAQLSQPPVTHYRDFAQRQTGMYRITTILNDAQAAQVIRACCHKKFCLKRRLWTVEGLPPDDAAEKSLIPCLEPCAVLLEFARKSMRIEQQDKIEIATDEAATVVCALQTALEHPAPGVREADFNAPNNPRRIQLVLEKLRPTLKPASATDPE
ncbi:MAG: hypothetical protein HY298_16480 [Verrucomicrobia bacterium]|nr:hypothetical protein [Verrucomicrobiota bacterium]